MFKKIKGQIGLIPLLTTGGAILVALIGGYFGQSSRTDAALEESKKEWDKSNLAMVERVAKVEVKVDSLQKDTQEIKGDIKQLLKLLK